MKLVKFWSIFVWYVIMAIVSYELYNMCAAQREIFSRMSAYVMLWTSFVTLFGCVLLGYMTVDNMATFFSREKSLKCEDIQLIESCYAISCEYLWSNWYYSLLRSACSHISCVKNMIAFPSDIFLQRKILEMWWYRTYHVLLCHVSVRVRIGMSCSSGVLVIIFLESNRNIFACDIFL